MLDLFQIIGGFGQSIKLNSYSGLSINRFVPNAPFLYPLKTSENLFSGVQKGCIGYKWVNVLRELDFSVNYYV